MHISWLGQTCIKLQTKNMEEDVVILIDAYRPDSGEFPRSFTPQIAAFSRGLQKSATLSQDPFVLDTLGEVEQKGVMIYSFPGLDGGLVFRINAEGMNLVHLGQLPKKPEDHLMEKIGSPDVLFVPVGDGNKYLDAEAAAALVNELEPRIVIPMAYRCDTDPKAGTVEDFIKETGLTPEKSEGKVIIRKKDLPQEERKLIILNKDY